MAEPDNPFHFGSPAEGDAFADREHELEDVVGYMLNGQNVILLAPRRYGKTSLLLEAITQVRKRRGRSGYASLLFCSSNREIAETLLTAVLNGPLSWLTTQRSRLAQLLGRIRLQPRLEFDALGNFNVSLAAHRPDEDWRQVISTVLRLLTDSEAGKRPVSLVLDEFQQVAEIDAGLPALFKVMADELRHVSLVFCGSRMHVMQRIAVGPGAPLMGMGERISLDLVPEDAMSSFLMRRMRSAGKQLSASVARRMFHLVDGVPNDVQLLAYETFPLGHPIVTDDVVDSAIANILSHRTVDYAELFTRLAPTQQRLLKALARYPGAALYGRQFVNEVDVANASVVRKALNALAEDELVARREGKWTVADAFFRRWLAQASP